MRCNHAFSKNAKGWTTRLGESIAKSLSYWGTKNGDDTMVTLWNPADEAQDLVFTLFFSGGHYRYPIHLEPRATHTFDVSAVVHSQIPDDEGNLVPSRRKAARRFPVVRARVRAYW